MKPSRVGGGERGVVDFGKLFTETNEQKFSRLQQAGHFFIEKAWELPPLNNLIFAIVFTV